MKNRIGIILLAVICLGLAIVLITIKNQSSEQKKTDTETIMTLSNKWVEASGKLEEQRNVTAMLEKDIETQKKSFLDLTNTLTRVSGDLAQTTANLSKTEASLKATEEELKKRDNRITELELQNQALDKQALELTNAITGLTVQIAETQRKLASSEGDKALLEKELKRLTLEKADLERQFNDLTVLRAQVAKLKEELSIARRIDWIRQGLFTEDKGASRLMRGISSPQPKPQKPVFDLNVEVSADGSVRVIPPLTNRPAGTNPPAR